jgi:hypothetical protein
MTYKICFMRSDADDRYAFKTDRYLVGQEIENLITRKLRSAGFNALPILRDWSCPVLDEECGQYEITASFTTCLPFSQVEQLFRQAVVAGLGGDFRICRLPAVFEQMASMN